MAKKTIKTGPDMVYEFVDNSDIILKMDEQAKIAGLSECGEKAVGYAQDLVRENTGYLKNSITYALSGESAAIDSYKADRPDKSGKMRKGSYSGDAPTDKSGVTAVYIGSNVDYAKVQEVGSHKMKAAPYLKPAVADHTQTYENIIKRRYENAQK